MNNETTPNNLIILLDTIINMQLLVENLEQIQGTHYNKGVIKADIKSLIKKLDPLIKRDYNIVFKNGEEETRNIMFEKTKLIRYISLHKMPTQIILSQFIEAWDFDKKTIEATVHRIIKKNN